MKGWSSFAVGGACAAAVAAALWQAPGAFRQLDANAAGYAHQTPLERSLHAAYGERIDPRFLVLARQLMPARDTYAVITGNGARDASPSALVAIAPFAGYWLLPRRQEVADGPTRPSWVLSYGGNLRTLGFHYARIVTVAPGLAIAKVAP